MTMITQTQSQRPIKDLFGPNGWHVEPQLLEPSVVSAAHEFLDDRRLHLQDQFEQWVGEPMAQKGYAFHQGQVKEYESRGLPKDLRHYLRGEFDLQTRLDERLVRVLSTPKCRTYIAKFLEGDGYIIHYPPMVRFKVADAPSSVLPPHQDAPYNAHLNDFLTVWVPLVPIDEDCGGLIIYDASHTTELVPHVASGAWEAQATGDHSQFHTRHVLMDVGDILTFPPSLLHESAPHRSDRIRYSIDFRVVRSVSDTTKSYFDPFTGKITRTD
jgi:hypothetical protein